ncbi:uncharacterized protein LOC134503254 isoform X1 [Candoia aspera]|uniref:uncharacterized protein LOC134503254 isoform X1 n=1 Tax=Candoia aspera TaxID=51853 RepID=UPI002FD7E882
MQVKVVAVFLALCLLTLGGTSAAPANGGREARDYVHGNVNSGAFGGNSGAFGGNQFGGNSFNNKGVSVGECVWSS